MDFISYDDFKKLDARLGKVLVAEAVPDSDKLIRFELDFGLKPKSVEPTGSPDHSAGQNDVREERDIRQILSAIREWYPQPERLIGKQMLFVVNLAPRVIRGLESHGMLMAVDGVDGAPVFLVAEKDAAPGAKVR